MENTIMKRFGQFCFTFLPLLLCIGLQYLVMIFAMGISGLIRFTAAPSGEGLMEIYSSLVDLWTNTTFNTWIMIFFSLSCIVIYGLWYYMRYDAVYLPQVKKTFHPLMFAGILLLVPGLQYLSSYIVSGVSALVPAWLEQYMKLLESAGMTSSLTVSMFFYSVLLAPISEELIYRGVTMHHAKKFLPFWAANIFQAVLFGIFHMNMIQGIYAFCLGLFLGYVCEKGGNLYHSILLHMLFNFWGTVLSGYFTIQDNLISIAFWFIFAIAATTSGILVFRQGSIKLKLRCTQTEAPEAPL